MTRLDFLIERARNTGVDRAAGVRYVRELSRRVASHAIIGETVGGYHIVRQIGEGGMGAVYLGTHSILGRPGAIKVLHPELSSNRDIVGRFFNEARAAAAIRHPGIVDIYDFGFLADGSGYIAMEYLEGETLGTRLRRCGWLSAGSATEIARQIASALHAAHGKAITHRDLKPDNVFLVQDPEIGERVKLLDFGIAKLAADDTRGPHTRTGMVMGTPVYMSPEQCRGVSTLDGRSDLYSLGCILYELLAGRPVFDANAANEIVAHHMYFQPEPIRSQQPSVPELLAELIDRLLSKNPAMWPATASDVVAMLEHCKTSESTPRIGGDQPAAIARVASAPERSAEGVPTTLIAASGAVSGRAGSVSTGRRSRRPIWPAAAAVLIIVGAVFTTGRSVSPPVSAPPQQPILLQPGSLHVNEMTSPGMVSGPGSTSDGAPSLALPPDAALASPPAQPAPAAPAVRGVEPPTLASPRSETLTTPPNSKRARSKAPAKPPPIRAPAPAPDAPAPAPDAPVPATDAPVPTTDAPVPATDAPAPPIDAPAPPIDEEKLLEKRK
jgi:serine/threonine-protein kinase